MRSYYLVLLILVIIVFYSFYRENKTNIEFYGYNGDFKNMSNDVANMYHFGPMLYNRINLKKSPKGYPILPFYHYMYHPYKQGTKYYPYVNQMQPIDDGYHGVSSHSQLLL